MKILMVLTSHDRLGDTGHKTGFWLEEFAAPYYVLKDAGAEITLASPKGGQPPLDPKSDEPDAQTDDTRRFRADKEAMQALATLLRCVFWFHPLVHVAAARFRFDQELACDAAVVARFPEARRSYGDAMLKTQLAAFGLPLGCHWQSCHPLKERISMLKQTLPGPRRRRVATALVLSLAAAASLAAWAAQPLSTRMELVRRFANEVRKENDKLATLIEIDSAAARFSRSR